MSAQTIEQIRPEHIALTSTKENVELARHYLATASLAEALERVNFVGDNKFLNFSEKQQQERREKAEKFFTELLTLLIGGKPETKEGVKGHSAKQNTSKGLNSLFEMEAVLLALEEMMVDNDQKKAGLSSNLGNANTQAMTANYKALKKEIYNEQHQHESFWDQIADFFKGLWDGIEGVFDEMIGHDNTAEANFESAKENFGQVKDALENLGKLVGRLLLSAGEGLVGGLADMFSGVSSGADKFAHSTLDHAKNNGEDVLSNPAFAFVGAIVSVIIIAASVVSQQYELAAVAVALLVLSQTGAFTKITGAIAQDLEKDGMSKKDAKIFADVLTITIVLLASMGVGAVGSVETMTDEAAQQAETELRDFSSSVDDALTNSEDENPQTSGATKKTFNGKQFAGVTLTGTSTALGTSSLAFDLASKVDPKNEKLLIALEMIQELIAVIAGIGGGVTMMSASSGETAVGKGLKSLFSRFTTYFEENSTKILEKVQKIYIGSSIIGAAAKAGQGGEQIIQGEIQKYVGELQYAISILTNSSNLDTAQVKDDMRELKSHVKGMDAMVDSFDNLFDGLDAVTEALLQG